MANGGFLRAFQGSGPNEAWYMLFNALMSPDDPDLTPAINYVKEDKSYSDEFRYGLEGLHSFREFYIPQLPDYTPEQRTQIASYDEDWSLELLDQLHRKRYGTPDGEAPEYALS